MLIESLRVNLNLIKMVGAEASIIYTYLLEIAKRYSGDDGYFYLPIEDIANELRFTPSGTRKNVRKLIELGVISEVQLGMPCKRYIKIEEEI